MRRRRFSTVFFFSAAWAALLVRDGTAHAQSTGLSLNRFDPAPAGDRMFGVPSPFAAGDLTPHVMVLGDYAHKPLVLRSTSNDETFGSVVRNQFFLHLNGGVSLFNRLNLNVDIPIAAYQNGNNPNVGVSFQSPNEAQFGDLRFGLRFRIFGEYFDPFQIAVGGYVWAPTAPSDSYVGTGKAHGMPQLILGGMIDRFVWSAAVGPDLQKSASFGGIKQGTMFKWGAGVGFLLLEDRHLQLGVESYGAVTLDDVQKHTTNAEILADVRYRIIDDLELGIGAGPGLSSGIGTPDFRGVGMIAYTPEQKQDRDKDGILDRDDACPDEPGVADPDPKKNGCPPPKDRDKDGVLDADDACPDVKGLHTDNPQTNGCPDTDGDGIFDDKDACPTVKGPADPDPKKNGCPKVMVTDKEIVITEQVQFDTGKATIKRVSDDLLDQVAGVLRDHPEILQVEVQGHTDSQGSRGFNKQLSSNRASAVKKALVKRGIDTKRLTAKGFGQDVPIADNTTEAGRQTNRRVQFKIIEKRAKENP